MPAQTSLTSFNSVTPFRFESYAVRVVMRDNEPWFVAADICEALSIGTEAIRRVDDEDKGLHITQTLGGDQQVAIINESGLYSLVLTSRKPEAKRFKRWVTSEVLPSIRKTGSYTAVTDPRTAAIIESLVRLDAVEQAQKRQEQETKRLQEHVQRLEDRIDTDTRYFTIVGWHNLKKASICKADASRAGRKASTLSRQRGVAIGQVFDAQHGTIHTYHQDILTELFGPTRKTPATILEH